MVFRNLERKIVRIFQKAREISEGGRGTPELEDRPRYVGSVYVPYQSMPIVSTMVVMEHPMVCSFGYLPDAGWEHEQPRQAAYRRRPIEVRDWTLDPPPLPSIRFEFEKQRALYGPQHEKLVNPSAPRNREAGRDWTRQIQQFTDPLVGPVKIEPPIPVDVFQVERIKKGDDDPGPSSLA